MIFYDVVAVDIKDRTVRLMAEGKGMASAEAIVSMAVMRRGVETEFYVVVSAGSYREGDKWQGER